MIRYYIVGIFAVLAWDFLWVAVAYNCAWKRGYKVGYEEGVRDGFKEGAQTKEETWWKDAEKSVDEEKARLWRESGAA